VQAVQGTLIDSGILGRPPQVRPRRLVRGEPGAICPSFPPPLDDQRQVVVVERQGARLGVSHHGRPVRLRQRILSSTANEAESKPQCNDSQRALNLAAIFAYRRRAILDAELS
jgi:hypothetical protein